MEEFCVYMVCCDDGSYYIGITNDPVRRVWEHNVGNDPRCYTFTRRPVRLVYSSVFSDVREAIAWEKRIKGWSRAKKEALIRGDWELIGQLSAGKASAAGSARRRIR
jgi:putative endonuclease